MQSSLLLLVILVLVLLYMWTDYLHARAWTVPGAGGAEDQQMKITERKGRPWKKAGPSLSQI